MHVNIFQERKQKHFLRYSVDHIEHYLDMVHNIISTIKTNRIFSSYSYLLIGKNLV